jgi:branched-chain amino acid aminotransferase group I
MEQYVHLNGKLIRREDARISVFDHGFLYGNGLFETMRAYRGKIFRAKQHLKRLFLSIECLQYPLALTPASLEKAVYETIEANRTPDASIRLTVTRGKGDPVPDPETCGDPTVIIITRPYLPPSPALYSRGYSAMIVRMRQSAQLPAVTMKTSSFITPLLARREAKTSGCNEGIVVNTDGFLTECTVSNIFMLRGDRLQTPSRETGLLPGITREAVMELAERHNLLPEEGTFTPEQLLSADEAFVTNSLIEIMPLVKVDGHRIGSGSPGAATRKLMTAYRELVQRELKLRPGRTEKH